MDVHQVGYTLTALPLSVALEEFANLKEEHHEYCLGILGLCAGKKAYAQGTNGGDGHQEVFIEHVAADDTLGRLPQSVVADEQVGHQVDQQQLPGGQVTSLLDHDGRDEQQYGNGDKD